MGKLVTPRSSSKQFFRRTNINKFQLQLVNKKPPEQLKAKFVKLIETYQSSRITTRVLTGNFMAAKRSASRAISSLTPSISNIILPGFTLQAQKSTEPLPLPNSNLNRLGSNRCIRKNSYPNPTLPFHVTCHSTSSGLDLSCSHSLWGSCLQSISSKVKIRATLSEAPNSAFV